MVFHRDGGVITLETVARFGLGSLLHPHTRPRIYTISFTISAPAGWKTNNEWSYLAVEFIIYHICPCGCGVRGKMGNVQRNKNEGGMGERKLERGGNFSRWHSWHPPLS